jgi:hypothetical protein
MYNSFENSLARIKKNQIGPYRDFNRKQAVIYILSSGSGYRNTFFVVENNFTIFWTEQFLNSQKGSCLARNRQIRIRILVLTNHQILTFLVYCINEHYKYCRNPGYIISCFMNQLCRTYFRIKISWESGRIVQIA